jgi:hypothetical protein
MKRSELVARAARILKQRGKPKLAAATRKLAKAGTESLIEYVLPMKDTAELTRILKKAGDKQSADLVFEIWKKFRKDFSLDQGQSSALRRLRNSVEKRKTWSTDLIRNNVFKAADALKMKLPSGMF